MDKAGVHPDVLVDLHPDDVVKGIDAQIAKAVDVLKNDVVVWKKSARPLPTTATAETPAANTPTAAGPTSTPAPRAAPTGSPVGPGSRQ
jgi:hypothetical protein